MKQLLAFLLLTGVVLMNACQKETSFESGGDPSEGSLQQSGAGDCAPMTVTGAYVEGTALDGNTNQVSVDIDVTKTGAYTIYTDTVNGVFFRATGVFPTLGNAAVTLRGSGTPLGAGTFNFQVIYEGMDTCTVSIPFLPAGSGGPATFTYVSSGSNCSSTNQAGTYLVGTALTASNTVTLTVNVTAIGTYNITTPAVGGMTFSGSGAFTTTGNQTVVLTGSGTPTTAGQNNITVTSGSSTCTFSVAVASGGATGTLGGTPGACTPVNVAGTYTTGTALAAGNTVQIQVNVTATGAYTISTNTVTGFSFSASGNFTATGVQNVTLTGTGTPTAAGVQTFTVTFGSSTCTFPVTVVAGSSTATGTLGGAPGTCTPANVAGTYTVGTALVAGNTVQLQVNVATTGTYSITTNTVTGFSFSASGNFTATGVQNVTLTGTGTPTTAGAQTFTVTFGSSTCTFQVTVNAALSNDYFPRTANSNWSYEWDDDPLDSVLRRAYPNTISAQGNTYTVFLSNYGSGFDSTFAYRPEGSYYRKNGSDYFEWFDFGNYVGYDNPLWVPYTMLKDNVAAGSTAWKSPATGGFQGTFSGTPLNLRLSYRVVQKDVPITINASTGATTYQNVIVVEEKIEYELAGNWLDATGDIDFYSKSYYARGIGLILYEEFDAANTRQAWMELRRYQVF